MGERLTCIDLRDSENMGGYTKKKNVTVQQLIDKLAHYKDLSEKGLLVELPCKVGDTVYLLDFENSAYDEATVELVKIENEGIFIDTDYEIGTWEKAEYIRYSESEAEQALADIK